jgi:hypothetical protein
MTIPVDSPSLDEQIGQWRRYLQRRRTMSDPDVAELEAHLRDQIVALTEAGLARDEAFLVAIRRMGSLDALSREFAREHSERLWKQLVVGSGTSEASPEPSPLADTIVAIGFAIAAAVAIKVPLLFGLQLHGEEDVRFYARNVSLFVLPLLTAYFLWKRRVGVTRAAWLTLPFAVAAVFANIFPFGPRSNTEVLLAMHLPIALWLVVGSAYVGGRWFGDGGRMDFVRFSGELCIYYVLIALGGGVLTGVTVNMFEAIKLKAEWLAGDWLIPCGAMGAVIIGSWLVEAKESVIENMAPVLTRLFTPLFTIVLLVFLGTMAWTGNPIDVQREVLIGFDLLLVLVVGLVLYAASAREREAPPNLFDRLQFVLVASALVVDLLALGAIVARISEFGFTPNRTAALGENIILLVNLVWSGWLYARFIGRTGSFVVLERWQVVYLPVYALWAACVVVFFPPIFGFR